MNYELRITNKFFVVLVLATVLCFQAGFVMAGDLPDGGVCENDSECKSSKCCCCPTADCDASHTGVCGSASCNNIICPFSTHKSLYDLISTLSNYIFYIGLVLAPLMIVIGAFLFMASGGSPEKAQLGKKIITWSLIGLAFILFAKGVSSIVLKVFLP